MNSLLDKLRLLRFRPESTEAFIEVVDIITTLRETAAEVSVLFDGEETGFKSSVRAINARHRVMVIDPEPSEMALHNLRKGLPLTLNTTTHGREISFRSRFLEPFLPHMDMGYQIEMPSFLGSEQPRGAFRVLLDELRTRVGITLVDFNNHEIDGVVKNISKSGIGMRTENALAESLRDTGDEVNCLIALDGKEQISCKMEIRNVRHESNGDSSTYVGGRMFDINKRDANLLTDFIENLQQQMLESMVSEASFATAK